MTCKLVTDTGCDLRDIKDSYPDIDYAYIPMKVLIGDREFVDNKDLDTSQMLDIMYSYKGKTSSACPSPQDWYEEFKSADTIIALTISSALSGSYNSALTAMNMILEECPDKKIYIFDSRSASAGQIQIAHKICELMSQYDDFGKVVEEIEAYREHSSLVFFLNSFENFIKNGRVNKVVGTLASLLNIKLLCGASKEGTVEVCKKFKGANKINDVILTDIISKGYNGGKVTITHAHNPEGAASIAEHIKSKFESADISIFPMSGLCCYYAERLGLIIAFEH